MAEYTIYMVDESDLTIAGGQLDGITQGDGSHLVGTTITINAPSWHPITITDNDPDFRDNDGGQRLLGDQVIDGVTYLDGTRVEAEYGITLSDGTNTWQAIGFNVQNSSPAYATVEGLAFIGEFPPVGVPLTVVSAQEGPNYEAATYATPICFVAGTAILTPEGERAVESLSAGDRVVTRDHGVQRVRWVGRCRVPARGRFAPVEFVPGAIGNARPLRVSPQHRVLLVDWRADMLFGASEVLVAAVHLVDGRRVRQAEGGMVTYVHLLFDRHEIIYAEGAPTESFHPGPAALAGLDRATRAELLALFPELRETPGALARQSLRAHEAALLAAARPLPRPSHPESPAIN